MKTRFLLLAFCFLVLQQYAFAQQRPDSTSATGNSKNLPRTTKDSVAAAKDSLAAANTATLDTSKKKVNGPRRAALRSAILPGWGQITNKKYWKLPIVYGALGATAYAFNFNLTQYKRVGYAYRILVNSQKPGGDTSLFKTVDADLQPFLKAGASNDLRNYRNSYRKDIDYSVLIFLFFWGLNVVDATVDAHLKTFDVSDDLSLKIKPAFNGSTRNFGLSFVLDIHKGKPRPFAANW